MSELLFGSATSAPAFETIGQTITVTLTTMPKDVRVRDFKTKLPKTYDDGNPVMQCVFTGTTDLRDPAIEGDSGMRSLYAKGQMLAACRKAIPAAGVTKAADLLNGKLTVKFLREEPSKGGGNPQKTYGAKFERGAAPVESDDEYAI